MTWRWLLPCALVAAPPGAAQLVVSPDGPYTSVAAAVRAGPPGARIVVRAGTYATQDVVVDRPVELVGEGAPVLDAGGDHQALVVTADSVTVRGFVFRNVATSFVRDRAAIRFDSVTACRVEGNRFEGTFFGVYLARSSGCRVAGNRFVGAFGSESRSGNAIHLWGSRDVVVEDNDVTGHRDGIYLEFARHVRVSGNRSHGNHRYGLHFMFSDSCAYVRNTFTRNGAGIAVMYARRVDMAGNRFLDNWGAAAYGLLLKDINDSRLVDNTFEGNSTGVLIEGSNRLLARGNRFTRNGWAVRLLGNAEDARFERNRFTGNAFDVATNTPLAGATFDANEWDQYRGYDLDRDGYGDVPFRPVRLFSVLAQNNPPTLLLLRSVFVGLLDLTERVLPVITPQGMVDNRPVMRRARGEG